MSSSDRHASTSSPSTASSPSTPHTPPSPVAVAKAAAGDGGRAPTPGRDAKNHLADDVPPNPQCSHASDSADWKTRPPYRTAASNETHGPKHWTAHCSCGRVRYWLSRRRPLRSKYCHCRDCQALHGAPFQWAAVFHKTDLHFERGAAGLAFYNTGDKEPHHRLPCKVSCAWCHTPIMDEGRNMVLMFPGIIKVDELEEKKVFEPDCHIFYSQRVVDIPDGKPKWRGLDNSSELMRDVESLHEVESVVSKHKREGV